MPTIINDKKLGRDAGVLQAAQAIYDAPGRNPEVERVPGAPPKNIQRLGYLLLRSASKLNSQDNLSLYRNKPQ